MFSAAVADVLQLALARVNILWSVDCRRVRRDGDRWVHVQKHKQSMQSLSRHGMFIVHIQKFQSTLFGKRKETFAGLVKVIIQPLLLVEV